MNHAPSRSTHADSWHINSRAGFSIVEVLLAGSIFAMLLTAFVGAYLYGEEANVLAGNRAAAALYAEEGLEGVRNIRDAGWSNLAAGTYGLATTSNQWTFTGSSDTSSIFTRQVTVGSVTNNRIFVTSTVTWQQNAQRTGSVSLVARFSNWIATIVGNWALPSQVASNDVSGNNDGIKIQTQGNYVYMVRSDGTPDFLVYDVTTPASPVLVGSLSLTGTPSNIAVSGSFAYVTTNDNNQELQIINVATPASPSVVGTFNATGNADATGVYVVGSTAYLVRATSADDEFVEVNVTNPASPTQIGSLDLGASASEVFVSSTVAYISSTSNNQELQVVSVAVPAAPVLVGSLDLASNTDATTITGFGNTVVIGQGNLLYTVDVTVPAVPVTLGSYNAGGTVNDISLGVNNTYAFIATAVNAAEFQVINITTLASPVLLGSVDVSGNSTMGGVAYSSTLDRAFGASLSNSEEFIVFAPS